MPLCIILPPCWKDKSEHRLLSGLLALNQSILGDWLGKQFVTEIISIYDVKSNIDTVWLHEHDKNYTET